MAQFAYEYDDNGNRIEQRETNGGGEEITSYGYDDLDRLESVTYPDVPVGTGHTVTYRYDGAYNRIGEVAFNSASGETEKDLSYAYNERNQLTDITDHLDDGNSVSYGFDGNGNQVSKTKGGETSDFIFDARDDLRQVMIGGSSVGQFLYDVSGLRIEKDGARGTVRYTYDGLAVLTQSDSNNLTLAKYNYGPNRLLSLTHISEGTQFYLFDALGSVTNLTSANGTLQARYQYDAWGNKRSESGSSWNRFGFTGHEEDSETGLIYAKARYYDPDTGRFLSHDPWEGDNTIAPSLHKYLYAYANPTVWIDPDGNRPVSRCAGGVSLSCSTQQYESYRMTIDNLKQFDKDLASGFIDVLADELATDIENSSNISEFANKRLQRTVDEFAENAAVASGATACSVVKPCRFVAKAAEGYVTAASAGFEKLKGKFTKEGDSGFSSEKTPSIDGRERGEPVNSVGNEAREYVPNKLGKEVWDLDPKVRGR
ncbi:hypothetical protein Maes01_02304 [Microbulbifer aestuariivivens]|uniref:Teneurin-like YD-shell domain-containing protein n=1 Tax=Microbulbifer aestuariivivens TaxID=1908308 RepID=A0ABP9WR99_9GAMM